MALYIDKSYNPKDPFSLPTKRIKSYADEVSQQFRKSAEKYKKSYALEDVRHYIFHDMLATSNSYLVLCMMMEQNSDTTTWWNAQKEFGNKFDNRLVKDMSLALREFLKYGHFHSMFMFVEDNLRVIVRAIDGSAVNKGTGEFKSIYSYLLKQADVQKYEPLFDLFRIFRNSIHNNGFYYHKNENPLTITYDGMDFKFNSGAMISVDDFGFNDFYDFGYYLFIEIDKALNEIFDSKVVSGLTKTIKF